MSLNKKSPSSRIVPLIIVIFLQMEEMLFVYFFIKKYEVAFSAQILAAGSLENQVRGVAKKNIHFQIFFDPKTQQKCTLEI